ncbi:hypothetical protein [uncultured Flavobacterium sp.]|uniref:hypothetical protein n=1 Tax=uncultured Flavobacterium sp. TaxID=165435 RepID=UPI0025ED1621|nr:hypothetical protein [uncultured Flavobacterium sp.]
MKSKPIICFLIALLLASCGNGPEATQTVKGETYSLQIPESMSRTSQLNDQASLQYQNPMKELYIIVIDETKEEMQAAIDDNSLYDIYSNDLQGYYDLVSNNILSTLSRDTLPRPTDTTINGLKAKVLNVEGPVEGQDIYWKFAFVEGKKKYYQIMAWTLANRREKHEKAMEEMIASFKETSKSKY